MTWSCFIGRLSITDRLTYLGGNWQLTNTKLVTHWSLFVNRLFLRAIQNLAEVTPKILQHSSTNFLGLHRYTLFKVFAGLYPPFL